jgi:hypothetical protein
MPEHFTHMGSILSKLNFRGIKLQGRLLQTHTLAIVIQISKVNTMMVMSAATAHSTRRCLQQNCSKPHTNTFQSYTMHKTQHNPHHILFPSDLRGGLFAGARP